MAPICKSLGHLIDYGENGIGGWTYNMWKVNNGWMKPRESPKRQTNTHYPLDSVILAPDHVNGARRSWANEVMNQ